MVFEDKSSVVACLTFPPPLFFSLIPVHSPHYDDATIFIPKQLLSLNDIGARSLSRGLMGYFADKKLQPMAGSQPWSIARGVVNRRGCLRVGQ